MKQFVLPFGDKYPTIEDFRIEVREYNGWDCYGNEGKWQIIRRNNLVDDTIPMKWAIECSHPNCTRRILIEGILEQATLSSPQKYETCENCEGSMFSPKNGKLMRYHRQSFKIIATVELKDPKNV